MNAAEYRWVRPGRGAPLLDEGRLIIVPLGDKAAEVWEGTGAASRCVFTGTPAGAAYYVSVKEEALLKKGYCRIETGTGQ